MSDENLPQVHLVRHGETAWSLSGQATGRTNIPLTKRGERDARELGTLLRGKSFLQVLTSPLQPAQRTAVLAGFGERAQHDPDLMEWDYGAYEGRRTAEIQSERPGWNLFKDGCPDGETLQAVSARAERVIDRVRASRGDVLVFAHRDILRVLAARWLGLPAADARRLYLDTAAHNTLGYHHDLDEPVIRLWNQAAKIEALANLTVPK
jgi:broad specificity phosphatase PhoE